MYSRVLGSPNHQFSDPMILRVVEFTTQTPFVELDQEKSADDFFDEINGIFGGKVV